ncbi:MAG: hypothetical protein ABIV39_15395 [Verrucomicrobiota bacterium]
MKKWILLGAIFLVVLAVVVIWIRPAAPPPIQLPNPNGYDDLVKAGQMIVGDMPDCNWSQPDEECLEGMRNYVKANGEALKRARLGLSRESRIALNFTINTFSTHLPELASIKRLAQMLNAEGRVAEEEGRIDNAIQSYVDTARLHEKFRGGVMIDELVGVIVEAIGVGSLRKLTDQMTTAQRRDLIQKLERLYANRDSSKEIMANEKRYMNIYGLRGELTYLLTFSARNKYEREFQARRDFSRARLGLFLVDLALRNFRSENGHPPKTLQGLVPKYLPFLPKDDFSGKDFIYLPSTNSYKIYGVGSDRKDNGGKPFVTTGNSSPGDMLP